MDDTDDRITRTYEPSRDGRGQIETVYLDGKFIYRCYVPNEPKSRGKRVLDAYKEARSNGYLKS